MLQAGKCPLAAYPLLPTALQGVTWTTRWSTAQHQSIAHKGCSILAGSTTPQLFWHRVSLFGAWGAAFPAHPLCRGAPKAHCHLQELCMGSWKGSLGLQSSAPSRFMVPICNWCSSWGSRQGSTLPAPWSITAGFPYAMLRDAHFCYEIAETGEAEDVGIHGFLGGGNRVLAAMNGQELPGNQKHTASILLQGLSWGKAPTPEHSILPGCFCLPTSWGLPGQPTQPLWGILGDRSPSCCPTSHSAGVVAQQVELQVLIPVPEQDKELLGCRFHSSQAAALREALLTQPQAGLGSHQLPLGEVGG